MRDALKRLLWYPHYWGKVDGYAVLILDTPSWEVMADTGAIAGYVTDTPEVTRKRIQAHNTGEKEGWLYIGSPEDIPADGRIVWSALFDGDGNHLIIGEGVAPKGAEVYIYRFVDGIKYGEVE